jgi:hypothetical protein
MALDNVYISEEMKVAYKKYCKNESEKKEKFILETIIPKLKWYHKLLFKIDKRLIKNVITIVISDHKWGVILYGKKYLLDDSSRIYFNNTI